MSPLSLRILLFAAVMLGLNQFVAAQSADPVPAPAEQNANAKPLTDRQKLIIRLGQQRIDQFMKAGKFNLAEQELNKLIELYPQEPSIQKFKNQYQELRLQIRFVQLRTLFQEGKLDEVTALVARLKQNYPDDKRVAKLISQLPELEQKSLNLQLGQAIQSENLVETERLLREILGKDAGNRKLTLSLTGLLFKQNRYSDATWILQNFLASYPNDTEILVLLGQAYLSGGHTNSAYQTLSRASHIDQNTDNLNYWLGRTLLKCEQPFAALSYLSCGPLSSDEMKWARTLSQGGAYAQMGAFQQAADTFCYVAQNSPTANLRDSANKAKTDLDNALFGQDPFSGTFRFGIRHDSNPGVIPAVNALGIPLGTDDSFANTVALSTNLNLWKTYNQELSAGYNFSQTINYSAHQFDLTDNQVYLNHQKRMLWNGKPLIASTTFNYGYLALDWNAFLSRVEILPALSWQVNDLESWNLVSRYRNYNFLQQGALAQTPFDLDSNNLMLGINKNRRLQCFPQVTLSAGYQYDINWADGSNFDYQGHRVIGTINWKSVCERWQASFSNVYYHRNFDNTNSVAGVRRTDNQWIATCQVQRKINEDWNLYGLWNFDLNDSNIGFNEYDRNIVELGVTYGF